jgi:hypothetical protein
MAEVLPVTLTKAIADTGAPPLELALRPTAAGIGHAALQLRASDAANVARWDSLPPLTSVNRLGSLRSGATVLLMGRNANPSAPRVEVPLLAFQRYGRGMGVVFGVQDSWLLRMHASMPVEDVTHATLWRQLLRWMVEGVPDQVEIAAVPARVGPGEPVTLRAHVTDSVYQDVNNALVTARVTTPTGRLVEVPMEWSLREDGSYTAKFVADEAGVYSLSAEARRGRDTTRSLAGTLLADDQGADVQQAELRTPLLKRVTRETGGRYYPLADASRLAEDVVYTEAGVTVRDARDLWDMPIVFFILAALLGGEWIYRRRRGLA